VKPTDGDRDPAFDRLIAGGLGREIDASGNACPDADLLAAWFDHTLSAPESERIEAHASGCACCQQILAALARSEPPVLRAAPVPGPARPWHWHWRWLVPLATAVVVVVVGTRTLRAPGPVTETAPTARLRPWGFGAASPQPAQYGAASPQPAEKEADKVAAAPLPAPPAAVQTEAPSRIAMASKTEATPPPADAARLERVRGADKMLPPTLPPPAVPAVAESVAVAREDRAARALLGVQGVRQVSVSAPTVPGTTTTWRFGQDGAIEKSADHGQTWERQSSGVTTALAAASAPTDRVCWIVGAHGVVLRTIDGRTWQRLNSPTDADLVAVRAWSEASAAITASDRSVYETADGGQSWRRQ
jgi:hypothetical protein